MSVPADQTFPMSAMCLPVHGDQSYKTVCSSFSTGLPDFTRCGFAIGYLVPRWLKYPEQVSRTVSIDVGMQNGGMAAMLAKVHFASQPLAVAIQDEYEQACDNDSEPSYS